jgi:tRNA (guanine-N7-)-methyltransferase
VVLPPLSEQRSIRSYVLRQGRMTDAQKTACATLMPRFGIAYSPAPLDFATVFGRAAPTVLEIGFGMGETTAQIAAALPAQNFLGIEVHAPGVGSLLRQIEARKLTNLRIIQHDAVDVLTTMIAPESLAGVHIFFPDPWPKKRHHKRRLINPTLAEILVSRLAPGGYVHVATDWDEYAQWILDVLRPVRGLENTAEGFAKRPDYRPLTKFEQRGLKLGHAVFDIIVRRVC